MATDPIIEEKISSLVEGQFPLFYREHGPVFVAFTRRYYEWMESEGQVLHHARRIPAYSDIDTTVDDFILHFKETYLKNIQLETTTNVRQLVKHSLDLYRSRGTERAIDLLFRLVFGQGATVYYPSEDILRFSDNRYIHPTYLEVAHHPGLDTFVGKSILGESSGATAFVERYVRKKSPGRYSDILYISAVQGSFAAGERINTAVNPLAPEQCPVFIGSLTGLIVDNGSTGFKVGDIVPLSSSTGYGGKGRVTAVEKNFGATRYSLTDGGFGYTANHQVLISQKVLTIDTISVDPAKHNGEAYFRLFEKIIQPMANLGYEAATGTLVSGDDIYTYSNGVVVGHGVIVNVAPTNTTAGVIHASIRSGNLNQTMIYTTGNAVSANVSANSYVDRTATGNVIGYYDQSVMKVNNIQGTFSVGEEIYQGNATATIRHVDVDTIFLSKTHGVFTRGSNVLGRNSLASANIQGLELRVGVTGVNNSFQADPRTWFYSSTSNTSGYMPRVSRGAGASVTMSPVMDHAETVSLFTDQISPYLTTSLSAADYGFPAAGAETLSTVISTALTSTNYTLGRFNMIASYNGGSEYTDWPVVRVYEPITYHYKKKGWFIDLVGSSGIFTPGEVVEQAATGARGLVLVSNSSFTSLKRLSFTKEFSRTTDANTILTGISSGVTANAAFVTDTKPKYREIDGEYTGMDAVVFSTVAAADGTITTMDVVDSGFGYTHGGKVTFVNSNNTLGTATARVDSQGKATGYFKTRDGFLSNDKKIQDGHYYQNYSYEVRSSLTLNQYADMLKKVLHVAGTKAFGALYHKNRVAATLSGSSITRVHSKAVSQGTGTASGAGSSLVTAAGSSTGAGASSGAGSSLVTAAGSSTGSANSTAASV